MSRVSLITTAYNAEKYLSYTVYSVLRQSYQDYELIIVDDGSIDNTLNTALKWQTRHPKKIKVMHQHHQGQAIANKAAHQIATGELIGWVDADDTLNINCLLECVNCFDSLKDILILYTQYQDTNKSGEIIELGHRCKIPYSKERLLWDFMTFHFRLYKYNLYEQIGGIDASFKRAFDYDFCLKASEITDFYHLPKPLYYYRKHLQQLSITNQSLQQEYSAKAINKAYQRRGINSRVIVKENRIFMV